MLTEERPTIWSSWSRGWLRLLAGALVWASPVTGGAASPKRALDEAKLREVKELKEKRDLLYGERKYAEATVPAERACSILKEEQGSVSTELADCLSDLALLYRFQDDHEHALLLCKRALLIYKRMLGVNHPRFATGLSNLASLYVDRGAYDDAEPLLRQALEIMERYLGPDHPSVAISLNNLAGLFEMQGARNKAEPLQLRALRIRESSLGPHHPEVALSLNNLASLYSARRNYADAESLYKRALTIYEKNPGPNRLHVATTLSNFASMYFDQGAYARSEELHERALAIREEILGRHHPDVAISLNGLGVVYKVRGSHEKAKLAFKRALAIWEEAFGSDHPDNARFLGNLATLHLDRGAYERARVLFERALAIDEKWLGPEHADVGTSLNNLAEVHHLQGDYDKAEMLFRRALSVNEGALGRLHPHVATNLDNLASLYRTRGENEKAEPLLERALTIYEKALDPLHPDVATALNNLAMLHKSQGAYERSALLFERALAIREEVFGPDHLDVAIILFNLSMLHYAQGDRDLGLELQRRALDIEEASFARVLGADESLRLAYGLKLSGSMHSALSLHLRAYPKDEPMAELALTTLLRRKNRVQDLVAQSNAVLRRSLPDDGQDILDEISIVDSRIAALSRRGPKTFAVEAFKQDLDEAQRQRDGLWSDLSKYGKQIEIYEHPVTIEDVQSALLKESALIEFIQYDLRYNDAGAHVRSHEIEPPSRYAAYIVFPTHSDWVDLGPSAPIDEHVRTFRTALQTKRTIPPDPYDAIMRPIVAKLGSAHHLVIAPAGDLSLIPFGALHDGERYLIEKYNLRYVTTGRDMLDPPTSPPVVTTPVTVVANPIGANLPDAELEAEFLMWFFPDTRIFLDGQATETNVRAIERPLILHLATHGFFGEARNERDNPMFRSGLYLADIDRVEVDRERDDGQLTAYEVSGMDLRGTQLVVLSACETGLGNATKAEGKVLMSEGISGLRRAFAMAGARTTVMSLWDVSGMTARRTMEAYYRKMAAGMGRGEAMQAVQLEMLRTEQYRHPKDWAAFIVSGDDAPIVFPESEKPRVKEPQGPPPIRRPRGCGVAALSFDRDTGLPMLLPGLLWLGAVHRRRSASG